MKKVIIVGAGGRDFHNFNVAFRDNEECEGVAFTAAQIPGIDDRVYPPALAGRLYPRGIRVVSEEKLTEPIDAAECDAVIAGTPFELGRVVKSRHPIRHVTYALVETGKPDLVDVLEPVIQRARSRQDEGVLT